jgi:glycosyltransferase involved in cell wall biosynthesis
MRELRDYRSGDNMLVTALLVKNERDKYLERVLRRCSEFSDEIVVLDDGSDDGSPELAESLGCRVFHREHTGMWGNESPARAELWQLGAEAAGDDWVLICDADMLLNGDPRPLTLSRQCNAWAWVLYDCWNDERYYRCDGYWQGHLHPRPWMFRPSALKDTPIWPRKGIHTGHAPQNFPYNVTYVTPESGIYWSHLAYVRRDGRLSKRTRYLEQAHQLSPFERAHAESVGD